ncbi:hypothetical protein FQN54_007437 [Arachnomyces sp. PD_36]|nr:hypothetical protein FQN54_007437 [Arachnomyces sp. PD_36]
MDGLIAPLQDALEGQIDYHGQRVAEFLSTALLVVSGLIAFVVGYAYQDIYLTFWIGIAGTLLTFLVVVPPWPAYNKHPEQWLGGRGGAAVGAAGITIGGTKG